MLKKIFMPILAIMLCEGVYADSFFNVELTSGVKVSIPFEDAPEVAYPTANTITIKTKQEEKTYEFQDVQKFSYTNTTPTGIDAVLANDIQIEKGNAYINGLKAGDAVNIYSTTGRILGTTKADSNGMATVRVGGYAEKIVIVKTPTTSFKVSR